MLDKNTQANYQRWLEVKLEDEKLVKELNDIKNNENDIEDRFYKDLEFGTGGLRGVIGVGTNRLNIYTVRKVSQGVSNYLNKNYKNPSIAIAYDSRINSDVFAKESARVYAANNIKVYIYKELMPTPALSYAVRYLKCSAGVVITASHNPSEYNGYKVYDDQGCQLTDNGANANTEEIAKIDIFNGPKLIDFEEGIKTNKIEYIKDEVYKTYYETVYKLSVTKDYGPKKINITYTPLNGAGFIPVTTVLKKAGFNNIHYVTEQVNPDGNFPTCSYPNPEMEPAWDKALEYAKKNNSDIVLATDPDSDRAGIQVKHNGKYIHLTGNEVGILLIDFICKYRKEHNTLPANPVFITTIVSTTFTEKVAKKYGAEVVLTLTGFKYIGEQMNRLVKEGRENDFIFGFEESIGYLTGMHARDKDATNAAIIILDMAEYYLNKGIDLVSRLEEIYQEFGYLKTATRNYAFKGIKGTQTMANIMKEVREKGSTYLFGKEADLSDYQSSIRTNIDGSKIRLDLPKSNVVRFDFKDGSSIIARPSGTEPKLKLYCMLSGSTQKEADSKYEEVGKMFDSFIKKYE